MIREVSKGLAERLAYFDQLDTSGEPLPHRLMTPEHAAEYVGVSVEELHKLSAPRCVFPSVSKEDSVRFDKRDLDRYLCERMRG